MLDYTRAAIRQTINDLIKVDYVRNVVTQIVYIVYLIYALIAGAGLLVANIILLILSISYFVFFLVTTNLGKTPKGIKLKKLKNGGKTLYKTLKRVIKVFTLGIAIYGICETAKNVSPLSLLLTCAMIVGFLLDIIFEILGKVLSVRVNMFMQGLEADIDQMLKPVTATKNFFKRITGQEVEPKKELTEVQLALKENAENYKAEQQQKKEERRISYKQSLIKKRREKARLAKEAKMSKKAEKSLFKSAEKKEKEQKRLAKLEAKNQLAITEDNSIAKDKKTRKSS